MQNSVIFDDVLINGFFLYASRILIFIILSRFLYLTASNPGHMKNLEIERKFLVNKEIWESVAKPPGIKYCQAYLGIDKDKIIRVRIAGGKGFLTIKGRSTTFSHPEYEYSIPPDEALELISKYTRRPIEKVRYLIPNGSHIFEVDVFCGGNKGLMIAEIELSSPEEAFDKPDWLSAEVTGDERYYNAYLSLHPYTEWKE